MTSTYKTVLHSSLLTVLAWLQKKAISLSPNSILPYHCFFPCTCLPAVALEFGYRHLLNQLLETLPPLLGTTNTKGLHVTSHISGLTSCYWLRTNSFNSWLNQPAAKLSYQYVENREIYPHSSNSLLASELPTGFQTSGGRAHVVALALLYKL